MKTSFRAYECCVRGSQHSQLVSASSRGQAKRRYLRDYLYDLDIPFTEIRARVARAPADDDRFARTAAYRGVPFARIGMRVQVNGHDGLILGDNDSANFDILFTSGRNAGLVLNCHPNWRMRYFDDAGEELKA